MDLAKYWGLSKMNPSILMEGVFVFSINTVKVIISFFMEPPMIYFVGVSLVGAIAGMAKAFIPMRKR